MPDAPMKPIGPEVFLRQYFTPVCYLACFKGETVGGSKHLHTESCSATGKDYRSETDCGRVDTVEVTVEAQGQSADFLQDGKKVTMQSGLTDLRLFRDGQLVGWLPENEGANGPLEYDNQTGK